MQGDVLDVIEILDNEERRRDLSRRYKGDIEAGQKFDQLITSSLASPTLMLLSSRRVTPRLSVRIGRSSFELPFTRLSNTHRGTAPISTSEAEVPWPKAYSLGFPGAGAWKGDLRPTIHQPSSND